MSQSLENARELDVRPIPKPQRHPQIFGVLDTLAVGESLVIKNDHNPIPLRNQVEGLYGGEFEWKYLEEGPEIFRLCFTRKEAPKGFFRPGQESTFTSTLPVNAPEGK